MCSDYYGRRFEKGGAEIKSEPISVPPKNSTSSTRMSSSTLNNQRQRAVFSSTSFPSLWLIFSRPFSFSSCRLFPASFHPPSQLCLARDFSSLSPHCHLPLHFCPKCPDIGGSDMAKVCSTATERASRTQPSEIACSFAVLRGSGVSTCSILLLRGLLFLPFSSSRFRFLFSLRSSCLPCECKEKMARWKKNAQKGVPNQRPERNSEAERAEAWKSGTIPGPPHLTSSRPICLFSRLRMELMLTI